MAARPGIAFRLKRIGEVAITDIKNQIDLPQMIVTRPSRPLAMFAGNDASFIVIAYDTRVADVIRLQWQDTRLIAQSVATTFPYYLPEAEDPVMAWQGNDLWFQSNADELTCLSCASAPFTSRQHRLSASASGELAGLSFLKDRTVILIRKNATECLVCLDSSGKMVLVEPPGIRATSVCACSPTVVAVAWSDKRVRFYDCERDLAACGEVITDDPVTHMTCSKGSLIGVSSKGRMYMAHVGTQPPRAVRLAGDEEIYPPELHIRTLRVSELPDGSLAELSSAGITCFRLETEDKLESLTINNIFASIAGDTWVLCRRDGDARLINLRSQQETIIESPKNIGHHLVCASNGRIMLLDTYEGIRRIDLTTGQSTMCKTFPKGITSIAADPSGIFWLADRFGHIFCTKDDGRVTLVETVQLRGISGTYLRCNGDRVIWSGVCFSHQATGEDMAYAMRFYQCKGNHLVAIGERVFKKEAAHIETFDYDCSRDRLIVAVLRTSYAYFTFFAGSIDAFMRGKEEIIARPEVVGKIDELYQSPDGQHIHLLNTDGALVVLKQSDMSITASLRPSVRFTHLSCGFVVAGTTELYTHTLRNPS
jgi:hypothetical protein